MMQLRLLLWAEEGKEKGEEKVPSGLERDFEPRQAADGELWASVACQTIREKKGLPRVVFF
jgi:hypothetical protein